MTTTATTNIYDSETNELIGPATEAQIEASRVDPEIDPYGFILIDADGDVVQDGTWDAQQPGTRKVYVS